MPNYALRVDGDGHDVVDYLDRYSSNYFVVREDSGDNQHVHVFFVSDSRVAALRKAAQRLWTGNGSYSLKECAEDYHDYLVYLCKGESESVKPVVVARQGLDYTEEWVEARHAEYWVNNAKIVENRQKRKRLRESNIVEKVEEAAKNLGLRWTDREEIAKVYIRMYKDCRKGINVFHAKSVVNTVACLLCEDESAVNDLACRIAV